MEPLSLIVAALVAGATAAAKDTATQAVKDAYQGLKTLVQRRFAGNAAAETALTEVEKPEKSELWRRPLEDAVRETKAYEQEEIVRAAQKLLTLVDPQQAAVGKYNVQIAGNVRGLAQGDHQTVTMNFGKDS
jgi:hypothetical protein